MSRVRYLRLLAGLIFIVAGLFAYYGVSLGSFAALFLVIVGVVVIVLVLAGRRPRASDIAVFIVALFVLGGVSSGLGIINPNGTSVVQYSSFRPPGNSINQIDLVVTTNFSYINIQFTDNSDLLYQTKLTFEPPASDFPLFFSTFAERDTYKVENETIGHVFFLNISTSVRSVSVTLPMGYVTNINATTGAGDIIVSTPENENLGLVYLNTGAGSINVNVSSNRVQGIKLNSGAGSVTLTSDNLQANGNKIPVSISTGVGSINMNVKIPISTSVSFDASTGLGSISQNLPSNFAISQSSDSKLVATRGDVNGSPSSFEILLSSGVGSINITAL